MPRGVVVVSTLSGARVIVATGGTREPIDPVRVITNRSSGKMGFALARAAKLRGADVILLSSASDGGLDLQLVEFETVESLRQIVLEECATADVLLMPAAVSDFRAISPAEHKIKKSGDRLVLELEPVPDFSREIPSRVFKVGFAAETENVVENASTKLLRKGLQMICANDVGEPGSGFGVDTNRVTILHDSGEPVDLPLLPKTKVGESVVDEVARRLESWPPAHER